MCSILFLIPNVSGDALTGFALGYFTILFTGNLHKIPEKTKSLNNNKDEHIQTSIPHVESMTIKQYTPKVFNIFE